MKKIFPILLLLVSFSSMAQEGLKMSVTNTIDIAETDSKENIISKAAHVVPNSKQLNALKDSYIAFVHFGPNTFTKKEWGTGMESPEVFNLQNLDTDQWCRAMKAGGMKKVILTVKHHDGFVLWQSRYTQQGVMSSPYKNGKGDILKELANSCNKYGLKLGVYLSPADLYQIENSRGLYGNLSEYSKRTIPRPVEGRPFENKTKFEFYVDDYNEYFLNQLFELLTEYGPVHEVWFDGAHPKRKGGQKYNYKAWKELIHTLAPEAVIFGKGDIRWGGNESGSTRETEWNVIPFTGNPDNMSVFGDLTGDSIGARSQLYGANFLHYQPAEINTSIREGWFYRDEKTQKTRSADDVFDIYERAVGGNSIFLLNIPPNRKGLFSEEDVRVLKEVGQRIEETYGDNLFANASGPPEVLNNDLKDFVLLDKKEKSIVIELKRPETINRLLLQEAVSTHSERIEDHVLEAWIDDNWKEVARGTNIGFKKILRFPKVTSDKFRLRVLKMRYASAMTTISAHFYKSRPPQLEIMRNIEGKVTIQPKKDEFGWKSHGINSSENLNTDLKIKYTTSQDVSEKIYQGPFTLAKGKVKAVAMIQDKKGSQASRNFGYVKKDWKVLASYSYSGQNLPLYSFDTNENTYWQSSEKDSLQYLAIDLGANLRISAFTYTPPKKMHEGMIEKGTIMISDDGKEWKSVEFFEFGNLINDPSRRTHYFEKSIKTRYIKILANRIAGTGKTAAVAEIGFLGLK